MERNTIEMKARTAVTVTVTVSVAGVIVAAAKRAQRATT